MERWAGKVAVVTGVSAGIGLEIAKALYEKGLIVIGLSRRHVKLQVINVESKRGIYTIQCDITDDEKVTEVFKEIIQKYGGIDILVNNAGAFFTDGGVKAWRQTFDLNLMALIKCTEEALKSMRSRGDDGHIVNISSIRGHRIASSYGEYTASKHALTVSTEFLRKELKSQGSKIKITDICPSTVYTDMYKKDFDKYEMNPEGLKVTLIPCLSVKDVANAVISTLSFPEHVEVHTMIFASKEKLVV